MHFDTSMSLATGVSCRAGAEMVEADRRTRSCSENFAAVSCRFGLGSGGNMSSPPLCHRSSNGLDIDQERLVFRRLDIGVADIGGERVRPEPLSGCAGESPVQRDSDDVYRFAITLDGENALGDDGFGLHRPALRPDP